MGHEETKRTTRRCVNIEKIDEKCEVSLEELISYIEDVDYQMYYRNRVKLGVRNIIAKRLLPILDPLRDLHELVGMKKLKTQIVDLVLYVAEHMNQKDEYYHCIITGGPGLGKTTVIKIMARIYAGMGITRDDHVVFVRKKDLISKYLGQTAHDTTAKLKEALGGVMVLDEAYQLAPSGKNESDRYGEECINTINQFLSENCNDFVFMMAGYKKKIEQTLMRYNEGMNSRFPYRFELEEYTSKELYMIFRKIVQDKGWLIHDDCQKIIGDNISLFPSFGRDCEVLFQMTKVIVSRSVWINEKHAARYVYPDSLSKAIEVLREHKKAEIRSKLREKKRKREEKDEKHDRRESLIERREDREERKEEKQDRIEERIERREDREKRKKQKIKKKEKKEKFKILSDAAVEKMYN